MTRPDSLDPSLDPLLTCLEWPAIPQLVDRMLHDEGRLQAVQDTELLDSEQDEAFERLVRLAAQALRMPKSAITLLEPHRQFFVSRVGFPQREDPIDRSFCQYAAGVGKTMAIEDTLQDPVLKSNPAAVGGVRSYLGVPLITSSGYALGTICVFGDDPRRWSDEDVEILSDLSRAAITEIELRQSLRRAGVQADALRVPPAGT